jgi:ABC-type lipoprotein release transport system permease subunit
MVNHPGGVGALIGVTIGLSEAFALTHLFNSLPFRGRPSTPQRSSWMSAILVGVELLASYIAAWRASRMDEMSALRSE